MASTTWGSLVVSALLLAGCASGGDRAAPPLLERGPVDYLAVGDSFSSGEGTPGIERTCGRGPAAYPQLVADHLAARDRLASFEFHACTGARVADVERQLDAVGGARFGLVTVTVGGNDVGFAEVLLDCLGADDVAGWLSPAEEREARSDDLDPGRCDLEPEAMEERIAAAVPALTAVYRRIVDDHLTADGLLVVLGYPDLFGLPAEGRQTCDGFAVADVGRLRASAEHLDEVLADAVGDVDRAIYLPARPAFEGHGRCGDDPWIRGYALRPRVKSSFHPNEAGHDALAGLVLDAIG